MHKVVKAQFNIDANDKPNNQDRETWVEHFVEHIQPVIGRVFDEWCANNLSDPNTVIEVDSLHINIGPLAQLSKEDELVIAINQQVSEQLSQRGVLQQIRTHSAKEWQLNNYLKFLIDGQWTVNADMHDLMELEDYLLENKFLSTLLNKLTPLLDKPQVWQRMLLQHSFRFADAMSKLVDSKQTSKDLWVLATWLHCFEQKYASNKHEDLKSNVNIELDTAALLLQSIRSRRKLADKKLTQLISQCKLPSELRALSLDALLKSKRSKFKKANKDDAFASYSLSENNDKLRSNNDEHANSQTHEYANLESKAVLGAGIVLTFPYWLRLFENLNLLTNKTFTNVESQALAIHALSYLVNGNNAYAQDHDEVFPKSSRGINKRIKEGDTYLFKLLLNWPQHLPLQNTVLNDEQMGTCDSLLSAIVGHWSALKSTSIDGLRVNFLQRNASLSHLPDSIKLSVEKRAQDLLLESIPWGFRLIKLPWLKHKIIVDWS